MTEEEIKNIAIVELENPTYETTKQYLAIHSFVKENNIIKIDRVDFESKDNIAIVYIPIVDEHFHFAIYIDIVKKQFISIGTESWNRVYFRVTSKELSLQQIQSYTILKPTESWSKGDLRKNGKSSYNFSAYHLLPNPEPDEFKDKLEKLLSVLEKDTSGIKNLVKNASAGITVAINFHNGNGMLGGIFINEKIIKRMSKLNLCIDFDLYADGNSFKD